MATEEEMRAWYAAKQAGTTPAAASGSSFGDALDWAGGATASAIWSIPETIGYVPPPKVEEWRGEHPVGSFLSQMAGFAIPGLGWEMGIAKTPALAAKIGDIGSKEWPIASKAAQEAVKWGGFGAVQTGVSNALEGIAPDIAGQPMEGISPWNIPFSAALGGVGGTVLGALKYAGKREPGLSTLFPSLDANAAPTIRARQMFETMEQTADPDAKMLMQHEFNRVLGDIKHEKPERGLKYVDFPKEDPMGKISSWFKPVDKKTKNNVRETRRFVINKLDGFATQEAYEAEAVAAGLDPYKFPAGVVRILGLSATL